MLSVKLLPSNSEILKLEYVEEANFSNLLVVCPSPAKADAVRSFLSKDGQVEVLTISKFIKDGLSTLGEDVPNVSRKSELLLKLATIWKIKNPHLDYDIFTKAFNLYTELRGFSLNLELLEDVLAEEEETLALGIRFFWLVSQELGLIDEHQAYSALAEEFRKGESPAHEQINGKTFVFLGFKHLSGGQLDLLKSIGVRTNVIIPIHEDIYKVAEPSSWIGWLDTKSEFEEIRLPEKKVDVYRYKKGRFSEQVQELLNKKFEEGAELYFTSATSEFHDLNIIPAKDIFYKAQVDPFKPILTVLISTLKTEADFGNRDLSSEKVLGLLEKIETNARKQDYFFRWLKVKSLFLRLYNSWTELSDHNQELSFFDIETFEEILDLDLPRNYIIPLFSEEPSRQVSSLDNAELNNGGEAVIVGGSFLPPLKGGDPKFSELQLDNLLSLGPIRSNELDYQTKKAAVKDLAESTRLSFVLEEAQEDSDIAWLELIDSFDKNEHKLATKDIVRSDYFNQREKVSNPILDRLSSTSLQTFIDCPKKYYYKYLDKVEVRAKLTETLEAFHIGLIEHIVIGKAYHSPEEKLVDIVSQELNKHLAKHSLNISKVSYQEAHYEISLYADRGLRFVHGLCDYFGKKEIEFEKPVKQTLDGIEHEGSVDLYLVGNETTSIIDFKRSGGGIPQAGEFKNYEKIQAWYYLNHEKIVGDVGLVGYLNLKMPEESLIYSPDKAVASDIKNLVDELPVKVSHFKDFEEAFKKYKGKERDWIQSLVNESSFKASPLNEKSCSYCPMEYVCDRGIK